VGDAGINIPAVELPSVISSAKFLAEAISTNNPSYIQYSVTELEIAKLGEKGLAGNSQAAAAARSGQAAVNENFYLRKALDDLDKELWAQSTNTSIDRKPVDVVELAAHANDEATRAVALARQMLKDAENAGSNVLVGEATDLVRFAENAQRSLHPKK
jgi:hypothetical protein